MTAARWLSAFTTNESHYLHTRDDHRFQAANCTAISETGLANLPPQTYTIGCLGSVGSEAEVSILACAISLGTRTVFEMPENLVLKSKTKTHVNRRRNFQTERSIVSGAAAWLASSSLAPSAAKLKIAGGRYFQPIPMMHHFMKCILRTQWSQLIEFLNILAQNLEKIHLEKMVKLKQNLFGHSFSFVAFFLPVYQTHFKAHLSPLLLPKSFFFISILFEESHKMISTHNPS